jgi:hypothetical protein
VSLEGQRVHCSRVNALQCSQFLLVLVHEVGQSIERITRVTVWYIKQSGKGLYRLSPVYSQFCDVIWG